MPLASVSSQTLGLFVRQLPQYYTHTGLTTLFLLYGIEEPATEGIPSKEKRILNMLQSLRELSSQGANETLQPLFTELVAQITNRGRTPVHELRGEAAQFVDALLADGWTIEGGQATPPPAMERPSATGPRVSAPNTIARAHTKVSEQSPTPTAPKISHADAIATSNRVFIVHGRDEGAKQEVARFVERLKFKAVVLSEQANKGRTVLEKFLDEAADAAFAIVLLTPDDEARLRGSKDDPKPRARQNVVFEFGYFVGLLGRQNVHALLIGSVEWPSDLAGYAYTRMEPGSNDWKLTVAREMQAAGLEVDLNQI